MTVPSRSDRRTAQGTRFPRLAQSGHEDDAKRCLLSKVKLTSGKVAAMSGNDPMYGPAVRSKKILTRWR